MKTYFILRSSAKATGEEVGEVHGVHKSLDPNYKPEHQSKSKLPSVTGKSSPIKRPTKPILKTPTRPTPKALTTPKSVKIQSEPVNDMLTPIPNPTMMGTPVSVHGGALSKTYRVDGTPLIPFTHSTHSFSTTTAGAEKNTFFYTIRTEWGGCG